MNKTRTGKRTPSTLVRRSCARVTFGCCFVQQLCGLTTTRRGRGDHSISSCSFRLPLFIRLFILSLSSSLFLTCITKQPSVRLLAALHKAWHGLPSLLARKTCPAQILIDIQNNLERIAASAQRGVVKLLAQRRERLVDACSRLVLRLASAGVRQRALQNLVRSEGETELWRRTHDTRRSAFEESRGALLFQNCAGCVRETRV